MAGEGRQRVGIDGQRLAQLLDQAPRDLLRLLVETHAGAERDRVARRRELGDHLPRLQRERVGGSLWQRLGHRLEHEACDDRLLAHGRRDRDEPASAAHRRGCCECGRARFAERAGHQEQMTVGSLVSHAGASRKVTGHVARLEEKRRDPARHLGVRDTDRDHAHTSGELIARGRDQATLESGEGQGHRCPDRGSRLRSTVRRHPRGNVEGDDGPAAGVDQLDRARDAPFGRAPRAGSEERVDNEVGPRQRGGDRSVVFEAKGANAAAPQLLELEPGVAADLGGRERE